MTDAIDKAVRRLVETGALHTYACESRAPAHACGCEPDVAAVARSLADAVLEEAAKEFEGERADWDLDVPRRIRSLKSEAQK